MRNNNNNRDASIFGTEPAPDGTDQNGGKLSNIQNELDNVVNQIITISKNTV